MIIPVYGTQLAKISVADRMRRAPGQLAANRRLDARHADRMRTDAEMLLQMLDVLHQRQQLEAPVVQAKQHADSNIVDSGGHGAVHRGDPPVIIRLAPRMMHPAVGRMVIGFLKQLVGSDPGLLQRAKLRNRQRGNIDIQPPDFAAGGCGAVYRLDRGEDIVAAYAPGSPARGFPRRSPPESGFVAQRLRCWLERRNTRSR